MVTPLTGKKKCCHWQRERPASWPAPEVVENMNKQDMGDLQLTDSEIEDIVAFLNTLTHTKSPH